MASSNSWWSVKIDSLVASDDANVIRFSFIIWVRFIGLELVTYTGKGDTLLTKAQFHETARLLAAGFNTNQ